MQFSLKCTKYDLLFFHMRFAATVSQMFLLICHRNLELKDTFSLASSRPHGSSSILEFRALPFDLSTDGEPHGCSGM